MSEMVRVRPRRGIILAGIPADGADVPKELADEWIRNGLVVADERSKARAPRKREA